MYRTARDNDINSKPNINNININSVENTVKLKIKLTILSNNQKTLNINVPKVNNTPIYINSSISISILKN